MERLRGMGAARAASNPLDSLTYLMLGLP